MLSRDIQFDTNYLVTSYHIKYVAKPVTDGT